ncbi:MAG: TonB-dependent receptor plug domain-containing protein [Woeseiaceae bacterium]
MPALSTQAQAQGAQDDAIEEIITTGLRGKPRSAVDSAVPIDTFDASSIEAVAHTDTQDILQTLVPSYNVSRQPISDGASFIRPAELRGLPSHHTLVLINGKRRHRAALVSIGGSGTQGPDVATIPSTAIQSIEVLRDGASSQYGSDAIAGVINFNLKDNAEGITLVGDLGEYFEGDGSSYTVSGNVGLPLGENGFLSISAEITEQDANERAEPYCESWFCVDPNNPRFGGSNAVSQSFVNGTPIAAGAEGDSGFIYTPETAAYIAPFVSAYPDGSLNPHNASVEGVNVMPWGQPNNEAVRAFVNAGIELNNGAEIYGWANFSDSKGDGSFFHRYPHNGTIEFQRNADGSLYIPLEKFPGGFTPRFEGEVEDIGGVLGYRGATDGGFNYDISARMGSNEIDYRLFNTINPSYGVDSPTDFRPGTLTNEEMQFQIDLSNDIDIGTASDLVIAYGFSFLDEEYDVGQSSDVASWDSGPHAVQDPYGFCTTEADFALRTPTTVAGGGAFTQSIGGQAAVAGDTIAGLDCTDSADPVYQVNGVGSNGFPGYSPAFSDKYTRDSYSVYGDISTDVNDSLFLQAAIRYEDYSDFGDELVGKVAGRYLVSDNFAIRGSWGTGFRAPTPGQQGTTNVSTRLPNGFPVATGLFPPSGPVAAALGAIPLKPETSTSYTLGFTADIEELTVTVDFYQIDVDDRFNAISVLDVSTDPTSGDAYQNFLALQAAGVAGANSIGGVNYFQNAFDSKTKGVDVVTSYPVEWNNGQTTDLAFAMNWNKSSLQSDASDFLNPEAQFDFENADPNFRWNLTATHAVGDVSIMGRVRYFGESQNSDNTSPYLAIQTFSSTTYFDLEANWQVNDNWRLSLGARNLFDEFPDELDRVASDNDQCCGRTYSSGSFAPWMGGYYFGKVQVSF